MMRDRGVMEKNAAMAVKASYCLLDFSGCKGAAAFCGGPLDGLDGPNTCLGQMNAGREPQRSPPRRGDGADPGQQPDAAAERRSGPGPLAAADNVQCLRREEHAALR